MKIFISHSTKDKVIANGLVDFFQKLGISVSDIFCSSVDECGVLTNITSEVKQALSESELDIILFSNNYIASPYCLNEEGIIWFNDKPTLVIGLGSFTEKNIVGFIDRSSYIHRVDTPNNIAKFCDAVRQCLKTDINSSLLLKLINELSETYNYYIANVNSIITPMIVDDKQHSDFLDDLTSDDEKLFVYYIAQKKIRVITKNDFINWIHSEELFDINVENSFDLISKISNSDFSSEKVELDLEFYKSITMHSKIIMEDYEPILQMHKKLASEKLESLWRENFFTENLKVLFAYVIENKKIKFGDRWLIDSEEEAFSNWKENNLIDKEFCHYSELISFLKENSLVFESDWTSYGNPREFSLYNSLINLLFSSNFKYRDEIFNAKIRNCAF